MSFFNRVCIEMNGQFSIDHTRVMNLGCPFFGNVKRRKEQGFFERVIFLWINLLQKVSPAASSNSLSNPHYMRSNDRYLFPLNVSVPKSSSAIIPYSRPVIANSVLSPLSNWNVT